MRITANVEVSVDEEIYCSNYLVWRWTSDSTFLQTPDVVVSVSPYIVASYYGTDPLCCFVIVSVAAFHQLILYPLRGMLCVGDVYKC